jgi:hypothetical protein
VPNTWTRDLPAANTKLHEIRRRAIVNVRRVKPGTGVHDFIHVLFLRVHVTVEMDNPDFSFDAFSHATRTGKSD